MTYKDFAFWLEGIFDASPESLDKAQIDKIRVKMKTLEMQQPVANFNLIGVRC